MEEEERNGGGISLGDIFRTIFSQKWLALIIMVLVTVAGTLTFYFTGNPDLDYVMAFSVNLPGTNNTDLGYTYPDGSGFYYVNYATADVLNEVKKSNPAFADIDVNKIISGGNIDLDEKIETIESVMVSDKEVAVINRRIFSIKINVESFKSFEIASNYMKALAMYPVSRFSEMDINYNIYVQKKQFDEELTFRDQVNSMLEECSYIDSCYEGLLKINNSTVIAAKRNEFNAWVARNDLGALMTEADANFYLKDWETSIAKFRNELITLNNDIADATVNLEKEKEHLLELAQSGVQASDAASVIKDLQTQLTALERKKTNIINCIKAYYKNYDFENESNNTNLVVNPAQVAATKEFGTRIQKIYDELTGPNGYIESYAALSKQVYERVATVSFLTPNFITIEGDGVMKLWEMIAISLVIGIVAAMIIAYIVGYIRNKKSAKAVSGTQALPEAQEHEPAESDDAPPVETGE